MDMDCLEQAVWEFSQQGNPKVKTAVERLQKFGKTPRENLSWGWRPPGKGAVSNTAGGVLTEGELLSAERTIEVAGVDFSALTECMKDLVAQYKSAGKHFQIPSSSKNSIWNLRARPMMPEKTRWNASGCRRISLKRPSKRTPTMPTWDGLWGRCK
jgi:hypothetical protein